MIEGISFPADRYRLPDGLEAQLFTPSLVVHRALVERNVDRVLTLLEGDPNRWRPHLKTTKSPDVWRLLMERGIRQFKCTTPREARVLLDAARDANRNQIDLLVAYPHVEPALSELAALARQHPRARLSVLCEEPAFAPAIPSSLGLFLDLDPGMHRTGLANERWDEWSPVARDLGDRFRGLHYYDGHLRDTDLGVRTRRAANGYERLLAFADRLERAGAPVREIITSGTPTLLPAIRHDGLRAFNAMDQGRIHRVSAGTVVFHDAGYESIAPELGLTPAAVVMSRIISAPKRGRITLDAGSKSLAAETGDPCAFVAGRANWRALAPSEEHLPVDIRDDQPPPRGVCVALVPRHICPTVNLAERAVFIEGDSWRIIDIAARAHDVVTRA